MGYNKNTEVSQRDDVNGLRRIGTAGKSEGRGPQRWKMLRRIGGRLSVTITAGADLAGRHHRRSQ